MRSTHTRARAHTPTARALPLDSHTHTDERHPFALKLNMFNRSFVLGRQVINTLGMNKEEMAEVLSTFDAELLALSRIDSPHIVKVRSTRGLC